MIGRAARVRLERTTARQLLSSLPDGAIDVLIVDPPYATVDRRSGNGHLRDWFAGSMSWRAIGAILALARHKLAPDGVAFLMTNTDGLAEAMAALEGAGFARPRLITWDRVYPGLGGGLRHQTEYILVGRLAGSRPLTGVDLVSVPAVGPGTADRYPTEKPIGLGRELARIAGVRRGDLVVDPFVGSGALLLGSLERGAAVAGADISPRAIARATERLTGRPKVKPPSAAAPPRRRQPLVPQRRRTSSLSPARPAKAPRPQTRRRR